MKIELEFAELHNPLFLSGSNLQMKLIPGTAKHGKEGLTLFYDREEKELLVYYKDRMAIIPSSNVSSMTPKELVNVAQPNQKPVAKPFVSHVTAQVRPDEKKETANLARAAGTNKVGVPLKAFQNKSAQVGSPSDHVFSDGPGKVKD